MQYATMNSFEKKGHRVPHWVLDKVCRTDTLDVIPNTTPDIPRMFPEELYVILHVRPDAPWDCIQLDGKDPGAKEP